MKKKITSILTASFLGLTLNFVYGGEVILNAGSYQLKTWGQDATICYTGDKSSLLSIDRGDWYVYSTRENKVMHVTVPLSDIKYDQQDDENGQLLRISGTIIGKMSQNNTVFFEDEKLINIIREFRFSKTEGNIHVSVKADFLQPLKFQGSTRFQMNIASECIIGMSYYAQNAENKNFSGMILQEGKEKWTTCFYTRDLKTFRIETNKGPVDILNIKTESSIPSNAWFDSLIDRRPEGKQAGIINLNFLPFCEKEEVVVKKGDFVLLEYDLCLPVAERK